MSLGSFSSAELPTAHGKFGIHVLPEIVNIGKTQTGKTAATFIEHYAMVPAGFSAARPAILYIHYENTVADVFAQGSGEHPSVPQRILDQLSAGENGILIYIQPLDVDLLRQKTPEINHAAEITTISEDQILGAFINKFDLTAPKLVHTNDRAKAISYALQQALPTDLGELLVQRQDEVVRIDFPQPAWSRLFLKAGTAEALPQPTMYKLLTHFAILAGAKNGRKMPQPTMVRVHSSCATGDVNGSYRCDCGPQFHLALRAVAQSRGAVIYHDAEGRGVLSLAVKMLFYSSAQSQGLDTYAANENFGYPADMRDYSSISKLLKAVGIDEVVLLTNNPTKLAGLTAAGVKITSTTRVHVEPITGEGARARNNYLAAKRQQGGHELPLSISTRVE